MCTVPVPAVAQVRTVNVMDQRPEVRIGTAERERAQSALSEHFSEGRLEMAEFEERSGQAAAARTFADLEPIFADLPGGLAALFPAPLVKAPRRRARRPLPATRHRTIPVGALILLALLLILASHGWLLFLFIPLSGALHHPRPPNGRPGPGGSGYRRP